jgi:D-sedoheptulose 7-phosphate isomerase
VLVLFSTSGKSPSLGRAIEMARLKRVDVIALLGKGGGPIAGQADVEIIVAGEETARIQEAHTVILHLILEAVERQFA